MSAWDRPPILPFPNNVDSPHVAYYVCAQHHVASPVARNIIWKLWLRVKAAWLPQTLATVLDLAHLAKWGRWAAATSMESPVFFFKNCQAVEELSNLASRKSTRPRASPLVPASPTVVSHLLLLLQHQHLHHQASTLFKCSSQETWTLSSTSPAGLEAKQA